MYKIIIILLLFSNSIQAQLYGVFFTEFDKEQVYSSYEISYYKVLDEVAWFETGLRLPVTLTSISPYIGLALTTPISKNWSLFARNRLYYSGLENLNYNISLELDRPITRKWWINFGYNRVMNSNYGYGYFGVIRLFKINKK